MTEEDIHIMETIGKAKVIIKDGKIVNVGEPLIKYCPLLDKHRNIKNVDKEVVRKNIKYRIKDFGLFTEDRLIEQETFVGFGASEIFMTALQKKLLDAVVSVCDGAGTVITDNPLLVQGIGGRLSGLIRTSPLLILIKRIEKAGGIILNRKTAKIAQVEGVRKAIEMGYKKIGVTLMSVEDAIECKNLENDDIKVVTFFVHTTGTKKAEEAIKCFDMITACASKNIRQVVEGKIKAQAGVSTPIFAVTQIGKELILERAKEVDRPLLVSAEKLPLFKGNQPHPLV